MKKRILSAFLAIMMLVSCLVACGSGKEGDSTTTAATTAQIDKNTWTKEMLDLLMEFIKTDDRAAEYRDLDWSEEYYLAEHGDPTDTQSAL